MVYYYFSFYLFETIFYPNRYFILEDCAFLYLGNTRKFDIYDQSNNTNNNGSVKDFSNIL